MRRALVRCGAVGGRRVLFVARPKGADALGWSTWNRQTAPIERLRARAAALLDAGCAAIVSSADRVKGVGPPPPPMGQKEKKRGANSGRRGVRDQKHQKRSRARPKRRERDGRCSTAENEQ
jgi:hypothetical protein